MAVATAAALIAMLGVAGNTAQASTGLGSVTAVKRVEAVPRVDNRDLRQKVQRANQDDPGCGG